VRAPAGEAEAHASPPGGEAGAGAEDDFAAGGAEAPHAAKVAVNVTTPVSAARPRRSLGITSP